MGLLSKKPDQPEEPASPGLVAWQPNPRDRCDKRWCVAQAYVRTLHGPRHLPLLWCAHHFVELETDLFMGGSRVDDHRDKLRAAEAAFANKKEKP